MASDKKSDKAMPRFDNWYGKLAEWITGKISSFVASLFVLFAAGAAYGIIAAEKWPDLVPWLIIAPLVAALFAYYDRAFSTFIFIAMLIVFIIL